MKLSEWAKNHHVSYRTARRYFDAGKIPGAYRLSERIILIPEPETNTTPEPKHITIYSRVSSHDQKEDLKRQTNRLKDFAITNGYIIDKTIEEIASGMNPNRRKLTKLLQETPQTILVENRDRLARTNAELITAAYPGKIIIAEQTDPTTNDIQDVIDFMTSFCARQYGKRSAKNRGKKEAIKLYQNQDSSPCPK